MLKYLKYFNYVLTHKFWVFVFCTRFAYRYRMPVLLWRGLIHDWDKLFLPRIFVPYANATFGPGRTVNYGLKNGMPDYENLELDFVLAVIQHKKFNNNHHPEAFQSILSQGHCYEMPKECILEMVADWHSANKMHKDFRDCHEWYWENYKKIILHPNTRILVEDLIKKELK